MYRRTGPLPLFALSLCFGSALHAVPLSSSTHPDALVLDLSDTTLPATVVPYQAPGGIAAAVDLKSRDGVLTLRNRAGGSFGIKINCTPFDPDKYSHLVFDYKIGPDTKIDFFLRVDGVYHGVHFTGPGEVRPGSVTLGTIPNVVANGQWQRAVLPIRAWLRAIYPNKPAIRVDELVAGNWNNQNYLLAGINGNGPGATWHLAKLALVGAGPLQGKVTPQSAAISLNESAPIPVTVGQERPVSLTAGLNWIAQMGSGGKIKNELPLVGAASPTAGKPYWRGNDLVIPITDGAGISTLNLKLTVDGREAILDGKHVAYYGDKGELIYKAAELGLSWKDNSMVAVTLSGLLDKLSRGPGSLQGSALVDYAKHEVKVKTPAVNIEGLPKMGEGTFENGLDEWTSGEIAPGAVVERVAEGAQAGQYALRLTCPRSATRFGATIRSTPFDAARFPVITFNYRATDRLRVDFKIIWDGKPYSIKFTDRDNDVPKLGVLENIVTDGQWQQATIPLLSFMKATRPGATSFRVEKMSVGDEKWLGNARGLQWWVDNWRFVPELEGGKFTAQAAVADISGIKATSWILDDKPGTEPDQTPESGDRIMASGDGRLWLHVRAQNGAGSWSGTTHVPVILKPRVTRPAPTVTF